MGGLRTYIFSIFLLLIFTDLSSLALNLNPPGDPRKKEFRKNKKIWIFGAGWNVVDDNGNPFKKLFSARSSWNIRPYPTQLSAEKYIDPNWTVGGILNYNLYKPGKIINSVINGGRFPFLSIDAFAKYYFDDLINLPYDYDFYSTMGLGYTLRIEPPYHNTITLNLGLGFNYWINGVVGLNVQSVAKFGLRSPIIRTGSNYLQHSIGIIILFDMAERKKFSFISPKYKWVHDKGFKETIHHRY